MNKEDLALELFRLGLVKIGKFRLTSGLESPFYIDLKGLIGYPALLREIATMLFNTAKEKCAFDMVVGIATGGIPIVSFISCLFNIPMAYVRKEKREHGTMRLVEGDIRKKRVLLVDDVATTGGSLEKA
ncbi:MAG: orotate phosphoribosyltransferase, partial [Thaumarchaeota archaeon]